MNTGEIFRQLALKTGKYTLFLAILAVALHFWDVLALDKIPIPHFVDGLYLYILVNGLATGPFIYLEKRARVAFEIICPQCKGPLEVITNYNCPNCGRLEYKQQQ